MGMIDSRDLVVHDSGLPFKQLCCYLNCSAWFVKLIVWTVKHQIMKQKAFCGNKVENMWHILKTQ
jgi:hypothetical protein